MRGEEKKKGKELFIGNIEYIYCDNFVIFMFSNYLDK